MECWIYVLSRIGSVFLWVVCIAAISDALWEIKFNALSAIMHCALSILCGSVAWWLWV